MNYRHEFHAGNFADVLKHVFLTRILIYLGGKASGFRYIDTHAGGGAYDLAGEAAAKTAEWRGGIGRFAEAELPADVRVLVAPYFEIATRRPGSYPGSPLFAAALLRAQDRMLCCEVVPAVANKLRSHLGRRAKILEIDGFTGLKAFVPPVERRGLVLVDPPFEDRGEFDHMARALAEAWRKWPTGIYMLWYPVKDSRTTKAFADSVAGSGVKRVMRVELQIEQPQPDRPLASCGLLIVNPPFVLDAEAALIMPHLVRCLAVGPGAGYRLDWLAEA